MALVGDRGPDGPDTAALSPEQVAAVSWVVLVIGTLNRVAITSRYVLAPRP